MYPCACSQSNSHHKTAGQKLRAERRQGARRPLVGEQRRTAHAELAEPRHAATRTHGIARAGKEQGAIAEP